MLFVHVTIVMLNVWFLFTCLFIPFFSVVLFRNVSENSNKGFSQETHCDHPDLDNDTSSVWNFWALFLRRRFAGKPVVESRISAVFSG